MWQKGWNHFRRSRFASRPIVIGAIVLLLVVAGLAELSEDVMEGDTLAFDQAALNVFRYADDPARPIGPEWLKLAMVEATALGGHTVLILFSLLAAGLCLFARRFGSLFFLVLSAVGAIAINAGLKNFFSRERPDIVEHLVDVHTYSYPSGHALMSCALYLSFAFLLAEMAVRRQTRIYIIACGFVLAGLIGFTRIYLGVHYPTDIIAGWAIGAAWAMTCWFLLRPMGAPGVKDDAAPDRL